MSEFLEYAQANNIIVLGYPPHCTHALQGLDVVCFGKMKETWKQVITEFEDENRRDVTKGDFMYLFGKAFNQAFDDEAVKAAFRVTGVYPFNRTVISAAQMKPSIPSSTKGEFPLPQASPICAIMAVFNPNPVVPTSDDPLLTPGIRGSSSSLEAVQNSPSSSRQRIRDENIDPMLYTPSKRIRSLYTALGATQSGSFLISKDPMSSSTPIILPVLERPPSSIPQPNWGLIKSPAKSWRSHETLKMENTALRDSLRQAQTKVRARNLVIEGAHAQLVYQNLHLQKTINALNNKENHKKNNRALLFDGKAQVLSSDEFHAKVVEQNATRDAAVAERARNADARLAKKNALAAIEEEWGKIKADHEKNVEAWESDCQRFAAENIPKRSWPKKPVWPLKPKLPSTVEVIPEGEEEINEEDEDDH